MLPVILYSVAARDALLLDRTHVAKPFRDLIVAVSTRAPPTLPANGIAAARASATLPPAPPSSHIDEQCDGLPLALDASRVRRPLLAALLQSGWGVAPTDVAWSAAHNASVPRRLWAIGLTPHGPYSLRAELSFALRDTASRVALHALADEVLAEVKAVCHHFSEFGKRVDEVLSSAEHLPFLRRLNLLSYKLQRARSYLSLHNFRHAQYYILSTRHDLRAMREILDAAGAALKAQVVCH